MAGTSPAILRPNRLDIGPYPAFLPAPQTREAANELSIPIVRGWKAEIDRARMRIDENGKFIGG
jgi:hypothetical protein